MSSINPTTSNTLLSYSLNTMPDPLQASPAEGNTVYGTLSFVVSNGSSDAIMVTQLQFTLPVGTLAQQLTNDASAVLYASSPSGQWLISMTSSGVFTALPQSGQPITVTTDGIVFQFFNIPINQQIGTAAIGVNETASNSTVSSQVRSASFNVAKFPYGFFFGNFTAQVPLVQDGQTVTLTWQGSDQATYTMYWGSQSADVSEVRTWTSPALTSDTSFLLRASVVSQGETVTRDLSTTVIVANPELQATSLQVTGVSSLNTAALSGTLNVSGATTLAGVSAAGLSVSGTSTVGNLSASGLGVSGSTTLGGLNASSLGVSGATTLAGTTINGSLSANGASLGSTNINGNLTAKSGPIAMLGTGYLVASGTNINQVGVYTNTDGFAVAVINGPGDNSKSCFAYGHIYTIGTWFSILGGTVGSFGTAWTDVMNNNNNCMCVPVQANTSWYYSGANPSGSQLSSTIYIYWFPMGGTSPSQVSLRVLDESEFDQIPPPPNPEVNMQAAAERRSAKAGDFITKLEKAFDKEIDQTAKKDLIDLLSGI